MTLCWLIHFIYVITAWNMEHIKMLVLFYTITSLP